MSTIGSTNETNNERSIIGYGYVTKGVQAVCLKTKTVARLGEVEYEIISNPYVREFEVSDFYSMAMRRRHEYMAVNVVDKNTGLKYAVQYSPANLRPRKQIKREAITPGRSIIHVVELLGLILSKEGKVPEFAEALDLNPRAKSLLKQALNTTARLDMKRMQEMLEAL